jgi:hypothetical protein
MKSFHAFEAPQHEFSSSRSPFTFLSTPFLLDPPTKVRVLHLDACAHMRTRYQEAIVHQALSR